MITVLIIALIVIYTVFVCVNKYKNIKKGKYCSCSGCDGCTCCDKNTKE